MLTNLAQVFSSQGVVLTGTALVPFPGGAKDAVPCDHKHACSCFAPVFEQASARLELSSRAVKAAEEAREAQPGASLPGAGGKAATDSTAELDPQEARQVEKLKTRDQEVRRHEAQHLASAGGHARGGASLEYRVGPDGKSYAVGGHVSIEAGPVSGNPQATLQKAQAIQRAALAPADPSGADRAVAAEAARMARQASLEAARERREETSLRGDPGAEGVREEMAAPDNPYRRSAAAMQALRSPRTFNAYA